jgi:hypothetical protein
MDVNRLLKNEQGIINTIYKYFQRNNEWIEEYILHREVKREVVENVMKKQEILLIQKEESSETNCYKLTFLGIYLCPEAKDDIDLLHKYLDYLREKFKQDPKIKKIDSEEIKNSLNLSSDQLKRLGEILRLGHFWGKGGCMMGKEKANWEFSIPYDVEILLEKKTSKEYVEDRIKKEIKERKEIKKRKILIKIKNFIISMGRFLKKILFKIIISVILHWIKNSNKYE